MGHLHEDRPAPSWAGDVSLGVDAWTRRAPEAAPAQEVAGADDAAEERGSTRGGRGQGRGRGRRSSGPGGGQRSRRHGDDVPRDAPGPPENPEEVARAILLEQLTGRARSRAELAEKLAAKLVPDDVAEQLLDRFEEVGLVDDEAFARAWVSSRQPTKKLARRALAQELRRKGVDDDVAKVALDEVDPADEEAAARDLVRKKLRSMRSLDDTVAMRRLLGALGRKGFGGEMAYRVVREEVRADREGDDGAAGEDTPWDLP
ncbi:regulatory protein RecX [Nocardioides bruguierae]|uniref:regulatory protein RecX n=1 Tax=Nocardioides bruguierae TaxID=2945102 RepID=UPI0020211C9D|nr:regulatory protein RecX [Nocardioides bruguierae]MCL8027326.1 recombination regulator RecX [Nocardioides bruguierae]